MNTDHFEGKSVVEHLKEARMKGNVASAEIHGIEMPGHLAALADSAKEMTAALLILFVLLSYFATPSQAFPYLLLFSLGWILWKTFRSALLGWARMERLHRVIEEERWEIEHHRAQEKQELSEMYRAKGFGGKLLEEVVEVLMADDNRLLNVMLEEELGLKLEAYEHPLKQASGALLGATGAAALCLFGLWASAPLGLPIFAALIVATATFISAKVEGNRPWHSIIWNLASIGTVAGCVYFLIPLIARANR